MDYTDLDNAAQLAIVQQRTQNLENQYLQLSLRITAPAPGEIISPQDEANLKELETSLTTLHNLAASLAPPKA